VPAPTLKQLADDVRAVWNPPPSRPWSQADIRIVKLLNAIDEHHAALRETVAAVAQATAPRPPEEPE